MRTNFILAALIFALGTATSLAQQQDTVVIAHFDNETGETAFDDALWQALAIQLEQSPFLNVFYERGTPASGRELCQRSGIKAIIDGTISKLESQYRLELTAVACSSGDTLAKEQRIAAKQDVLKALSQASFSLRTKLGEPLTSVQRFDAPIETATFSLEALKNYSVGIAVRHDQGDTLSIPYLKRAIELDPDFPLPYAELTAVYRNYRQPSLALEYAAKAYKLRDRVNEREQLKIAGIYFLATGDLDSEIQNYERWQTQYPRDSVPYNNLGNDYAAVGQLEKSLAEYQHALQLMPSLIGYVNVVGMDVSLNRFDAAGATLDEAFASKLDGRYLRQNVYWLAFLRGNVEKMRQQVAWAAGKKGDEDPLLSMQSDTEAFYGRLVKARDFTQRAVDSAVNSGSSETAALWQVNAALREAEVGNAARAEQQVASALALSSGRDVRVIAAFTLARIGAGQRTQALIAELKSEYPTDSLLKLYWLPTINAAMEIQQGNATQALKNLEAVAPYELGGAGTFINYLYPAYVRGQAYLLAHKPDAAAAQFQKLLDHPGIVSNYVTGALAFGQLGLAYAKAHDPIKAKAAYQTFFTLWKDADPEIPFLKQAKSEYAALESRSKAAT